MNNLFHAVLTRRITKTRIPPYVALIPVCAGVFIAADDQTVVVTILPQIIIDMGLGPYELDRVAWTITGYLLGYVSAMPLIGRLSDVWGHRKLFILSMVLFMVGSAAVALTTRLDFLIAARIFQAVGAGALVPISIAIVGDIFPQGHRGLPLGIVGASVEAGAVVGPLCGGVITKFLDWQWVFWINIPLGIVVLLGLVIFLRPSPRCQAAVDYQGGCLLVLALVTLTLGLVRVSDPDILMTGYLLVSVFSLGFFVLHQRLVSEPLLPVAMIRGWAFGAANVTHLLVGGALIIGMVTVPLMANTVLGLTPLDGGLQLMRLTIAIPAGAVLGGIACQRLGYSPPTILGLVLAALGFWFMSGWGLTIGDPEMTIHLFTTGLGFGLVIAPIALAATDSVSPEFRGAAAGLITAMRMLGMTVGLAILTAWGSWRFQGLVAKVPNFLVGETTEQAQQRVMGEGVAAGLSLFNDFYLVAMVVCLIAIIPATLMFGSHARKDS